MTLGESGPGGGGACISCPDSRKGAQTVWRREPADPTNARLWSDHRAWPGPRVSVHICFISTKPSERNNRNLSKITYLEKGLRRVHLTVSFFFFNFYLLIYFIFGRAGSSLPLWVSLVAARGLLILVSPLVQRGF